MEVLVLGGTGEAVALGQRLAGHATIRARLSLAGRTRHPASQPLPVRSGGFGGPAGLAGYLHREGIDAVVDATHPFAEAISASAAEATARAGVPLLALRRPGWQPQPGDQWRPVADLDAAARALGPLGERVLLTTGRQGLEAFEAMPDKDYVVRTIDPPCPPPRLPRATWITDRGPFSAAGEARLLAHHGIEVLVTKASGGTATAAKLQAARERGIPVVMVERPPLPPGVVAVADPGAALAWLEAGAPPAAHWASAGQERGV